MSFYHIVVCGSIVPDPLQTLEPVPGQQALKNEMMLPHILDPFAAHALYEAANLAKKFQGTKVWLVSAAPKAKLQQVMMTMAQKVPFDLVAIDTTSSGFSDSFETAKLLAAAIQAIPGLDKSKLLLFGGWESASRTSGTTLSFVGELLGIGDQFFGVDELATDSDGAMTILERVEGGRHLNSKLNALPAVLGWATGNLPEPPNNPQVGMQNMKTVMPNLQKAKAQKMNDGALKFDSIEVPKIKRETLIVKDKNAAEVAAELLNWVRS